MRSRGAATVLTVAGAVTAGVAAQAAASPVASLAWALIAGVGASLLLRGGGLRILEIVLALLAGLAAGVSAQEGRWVPAVGFAAACLGAVVLGVRPGSSIPRPVERAASMWDAMDAGEDPTRAGKGEVHASVRHDSLDETDAQEG